MRQWYSKSHCCPFLSDVVELTNIFSVVLSVEKNIGRIKAVNQIDERCKLRTTVKWKNKRTYDTNTSDRSFFRINFFITMNISYRSCTTNIRIFIFRNRPIGMKVLCRSSKSIFEFSFPIWLSTNYFATNFWHTFLPGIFTR